MKISVLADNRTNHPELETEHGLSVYMETDGYKFLLDTGASDLFIKNAHKLQVDLSLVDFVFISHGHADHIGGLPYFLKINDRAKILLSSKILGSDYFSKRNELLKISVDIDFENYRHRCIFIEDEWSFEDTIYIYRNQSTQFPTPIGNGTLFKSDISGKLVADNFDHELIFATENRDLVVYTGCAHNGLLNILETTSKKLQKKPKLVFGGFHLIESTPLKQYETPSEIQNMGEYLHRNFPTTKFFTGHCTCNQAI